MKRFAPLAMILGGLILLWPHLPTVAPGGPDCLSESYAADRAARVAMLREMAGTEFANDQEQLDWHTEHSREILGESFGPYTDKLAEAIEAGTVAEFAEGLEGGQ